jgi:hypothetical protein
MLGVIAAIALVVGGVSTAVVVSDVEGLSSQENRTPVVEVHAVESTDLSKTK